ncbi:MAG: hypothetical protein HZB38_04845 [Planctomycetes bacterium]|nr:hypothetical protein [Planctomycetota bacterium]
MWSFSALCDQFCVSSRLALRLELQPSRETILHYLEQVRRAFPQLTRLRRREDGALLLDQDEDEGSRRYLRLDPRMLRFGTYGSENAAEVQALAARALALAPAHLSLSELDYDYLEVAFAFDLEYRGNHDELVAETLLAGNPLARALAQEDGRFIECQPLIGVSLGPECDRQLYLEVRGRTSAFEVRTGEFDATPLTVSLTARRYLRAEGEVDLPRTHESLLLHAARICEERVLSLVVQPLAAAIASQH